MMLLICLAAYMFLYESNSDVLFMAQLRSLFTTDTDFWDTCMAYPGGLLRWAGLFLTQLFYKPLVGTAVLTAIWLATFLLVKFGLKVSNGLSPLAAIPVVCLLASIVQLGYWIYYIQLPGYFFRESLGFLAVALLLCIPHGRTSIPASVVSAALYPCIGFYSLVALACITLRDAIRYKKRIHLIGAVVAVALATIVPLILRNAYTTVRSEDAYSQGFPVFFAHFYQTDFQTPFQIAIGVLLLLSVMPLVAQRIKLGKLQPIASIVLLLAVGAGSYMWVKDKNFSDENFHAECKAYAAADEQRWDDVLYTVAALNENPTRELVVLKNIALFNSGEIGNEMYKYKDISQEPNTRDSLRISLVDIAAPLIYLHHGQANYAYRWCIENNVQIGESVSNAKVMALAALISGDDEAARKHFGTLSRTLYNKEWAEKYIPLIGKPQEIAKCSELKKMAEAHKCIANKTRSDNYLCEKFLVDEYSTSYFPESAYMSEMTLAYSLVSRDIQLFWSHFNDYAKHLGNKPMPIHYQEAAFMYGVLEPQSMDTSRMPFDKDKVVDRYNAFYQTSQKLLQSGMTEGAVADATRIEYGDTFWWSYFFDRSSNYY